MDLGQFVKNELIKSHYDLAAKVGAQQNDYYEVQLINDSHCVVKNGGVIAEFNHAIRAHTFIEKMKNGL